MKPSANPFGRTLPGEADTITPEQVAYLRKYANLDQEQAAVVCAFTMPCLSAEQEAVIRVQPTQLSANAAAAIAASKSSITEAVAPHRAASRRAPPAASRYQQQREGPVSMAEIIAGAQMQPLFSNMKDSESSIGKAQKMSVEKSCDAAARSAVANEAAVSIAISLPMLAVEIIRDFWQVMSLVISVSFSAPIEITNIFGKIAFAISLDIAMLIPVDVGVDRSTAYHVMWWIMFTLTLMLNIALRGLVRRSAPDSRSEFVMLRTWAMMDRGLVRKMRIVTFLLTLLYLPVSQTALELVTCSHKYERITGHCPHWGYMASGGVALALMTVSLPLQLFRIIQKNVPKVRAFDAFGAPNKNPEQGYKRDIANLSRHSPVASLFNEYNRGMRYHKVTIMLLKCYIIVVAVLMSGNGIHGKTHDHNESGQPIAACAETPSDTWNHARPVCMITGLILYTLLCIVRRPFIATLANALDVTLRLSAIVAIACTHMISFGVEPFALSWVFNSMMIIMLLVSIGYFVCSFDAVQERYRIHIGDVQTTPVSAKDSTPMWFQPGLLDLRAERKLRVWQDFWTTLFVFAEPFALRPPEPKLDEMGEPIDDDDQKRAAAAAKAGEFQYVDNEDTTSYLLDFVGTIAERHCENVEVAADLGAEKFAEAIARMPETEATSVIFATRQLHGTDCWVTMASGLGQFGCLYILPVPYEFFFLPDDGTAEIRFTVAEVGNLVAQNTDLEIQRRRRVREQLRGLDLSCRRGAEVHFVHKRMENVKVLDGTDEKGNKKYKTVSVEVTYDTGLFSVTAEAEKPVYKMPVSGADIAVVPGFICGLVFKQGGRWSYKGESGKTGELAIGAAELGIRPDYGLSPELKRLLEKNIDMVKTGHFDVLRTKDSFRRYYQSEFLAKSLTLSYAFWPTVYNDDGLSKEALQHFLKTNEVNPQLQDLADDAAGYLQSLYQRLAYYDACPATALWVCFWNDVYYSNLDMSIVTENEEANGLLNPFVPTSISWHIMSFERCNEALRAVGLQDGGGNGFIPSGFIEKLFDAMAHAMQDFDPAPRAVSPDHLTVAAARRTFNDPDGAATADGAAAVVDMQPLSRALEHHEVMRHPAFSATIAPYTLANYSDTDGRRLQLILALSHNTTNSFYNDDEDSASLTHFQRYPVVAVQGNAGGQLPDGVYRP